MTSWKDWNPGLDNHDQTLGEVLETLPGADPEDISFLVRLIENPKSPFALPGAVALHRHDCIHILLGRGLLNQDEAFVIGFTMGASKAMRRWHRFLFRNVSARFYPKPYRFGRRQLKVFDLGLEAGRTWGPDKLHEFPFEEHHDTTLGELREQLGIDVEKLKHIYAKEQSMLPQTKASERLPVV